MRKSGLFTDKDTGWDNLMTKFEVEAGKTAVFVGFLRSSGVYKPKADRKPGDPVTMAQLGAIHEFGSKDGTIPERSFMRSAIDQNRSALEKLIRKISSEVIDGTMSTKKGLGVVGQFLKQAMQAKIRSGVPPANKPSTIRRKKSSKPLVDTGQLLNSIDFEVKEGK